MSTPAKDATWALSEKEKQTLRLIVRGHDAKSTARSLGLSVHTINERLRDARRKMAVSSSREAARMLFEAEGGDAGSPTPEILVDAGIGEDAPRRAVDQDPAPDNGVAPAYRRPAILVGVLLMILALALLALAAAPLVAPTASPPATASSEAPDAAVVDTARQWLALLDQSRWDESYRATGRAFRRLNTARVWARASERVRVPLGGMVSRTFDSQQHLPAPPDGYEVVKFRTAFQNTSATVETVTLVREDDAWRVVGVTVG